MVAYPLDTDIQPLMSNVTKNTNMLENCVLVRTSQNMEYFHSETFSLAVYNSFSYIVTRYYKILLHQKDYNYVLWFCK